MHGGKMLARAEHAIAPSRQIPDFFCHGTERIYTDRTIAIFRQSASHMHQARRVILGSSTDNPAVDFLIATFEPSAIVVTA